MMVKQRAVAKNSTAEVFIGRRWSFSDQLSWGILSGTIAGIVIGLTEIALTSPLFLKAFLSSRHELTLGSKISPYLLLFPTICYVVFLICMNLVLAVGIGVIAQRNSRLNTSGRVRLCAFSNVLFMSLFMVTLLLVENGEWMAPFFNCFGVVPFLIICLVDLALFLVGSHMIFHFLPRKRSYRNAVTVLIPMLLLGSLFAISLQRKSGGSSQARQSSDLLPRSEERQDNLLLITIDTQRADHIGVYNRNRDITPNIDRLANEGVRFDFCVSQATVTLPSHTSILTATYPILHGVRTNIGYTAGLSLVTLAEVLKDDGFRTGAFVSSFVLDSRFGLDQGFDIYDSNVSWASILFSSSVRKTVLSKTARRILSLESNSGERSAEATNKKVVDWLGEKDNRPFFAWVHYFDPHTYSPPQDYRDRFLALFDRSIAGYVTILTSAGEQQLARKQVERHELLYQAEVSYTDESIGRLLEALDKLELLENTLVVITADHGESFGENEHWGHGTSLHGSALDVPLIFYRPGRLPQGVVVNGLSRSIDIMPTILDYLDIEGPEEMQGFSVLSCKKWRKDYEVIFSTCKARLREHSRAM